MNEFSTKFSRLKEQPVLENVIQRHILFVEDVEEYRFTIKRKRAHHVDTQVQKSDIVF